MTALVSPASGDITDQVLSRFARRKLLAFAVPLVILGYLLYAAMAFDLAGLAGRARMDNARILLADFVSYKTHVTRDNCRGHKDRGRGRGEGLTPPAGRPAG